MLADYGIDDRVRALAAAAGVDGVAAVVGRVVRIDRGAYHVITDDGVVVASLSGLLKDALEPEDRPSIGDWVVLDDEVVEVVLERRSAFRRGDADRLRAQVVAANVDVVYIVHGADEEPNIRRLERELALAFESGATPVVVLTKVDRVESATLETVVAAIERGAPGVEVLATSVVDEVGVEALAARSQGVTVAFIGKSGVGKSSLVNALVGDERQAIGEVRAVDGRGRHTTTHREIFLLPGGGVLIDTPGVRSIGMWQSDDGIARVFADIEAIAVSCRFRDCTHEHEPGCAVREAVERGEMDAARVANHRSMLAELDSLDRESEVRSRLEKKRHARIQSKASRAAQRKPR